MKKFFVLLVKEVKEALTPQMIVPFLVMVAVFYFVGNVAGKQQEEQAKKSTVLAVMDEDQSVTSKGDITFLSQNNFSIKEYPVTSREDFVLSVKKDKVSSALVIPKGFESKIRSVKVQEVPTYVFINNVSFFASMKNYQAADSAVALLDQLASDKLLSSVSDKSAAEVGVIKNPVRASDYVYVGDKSAQANFASVIAFINQQIFLIPTILFFVIIIASQMIATAVAEEKGNKTLETLLSLPVKRNIIVSAKMVAAGIVSLLMAAIYMVGMQSYMGGLTGQSAASVGNIKAIAGQLGLVFTPTGYLLLGTVLFLGVLVALAIAIILGLFSEDAKSAQGIITPLMVLVLIPYFLTIFVDLDSLSPVLRYFIYAIPFTHVFLAAPNILLSNFTPLIYSIIYLAALFVIFVYIATKIFSSDYVLTMKISFPWKKKKVL